MLRHVRSCLPHEACGFLAGVEGQVQQVLPVTNELRSPVQFRMRPQEQLGAMLSVDQSGQELLAVYHSHPQGPDRPSERDLMEVTFADCAQVIWWPDREVWRCRAFDLRHPGIREIPILLIDK